MLIEQRGLGPLSVPSLAAALLSYPQSWAPHSPTPHPSLASLLDRDRQTLQLQGVKDEPEEGLRDAVAELESTQEIREGCLEEEALVLGFCRLSWSLPGGWGIL